MRIPLIHNVDVIVFGATSGATAAALATKDNGRSVVAVSDRSYFGEETAGALRLWPDRRSSHALFTRVFDTVRENHPPSPTNIKHVLETELLQAQIPFLYECRPLFVLQDNSGTFAGLVFAARSSLFAVQARVAVDASRTGVLTRLAGIRLHDTEATHSRSLVVLGGTAPTDAAFTATATKTPISVLKGDNMEQVSAYELTIESKQRTDSFVSKVQADHMARVQAYYPGVVYTADTFTHALGERIAQNKPLIANHHDDLSDATFAFLNDRLFVMNGLLPLSVQGEMALYDMAEQVALGERVGRLAADAAATLSLATAGSAATIGSTHTDTVTAKSIRFAPSFVRPHQGEQFIDISLTDVPVVHACDVLVAGGGTAGAPAGIGAARAGANTVVLERLYGLGGVSTLGLISRYWYGNRVGFTAEIDAGIDALHTEPPKLRAGSWNPEDKSHWYMKALRDSGAGLWHGSFAVGVQMDGSDVTGVLVSTPYGAGLVRTQAVIDATGNADLAAAAGAPVREIDAHHVAVQGTGLSPRRPGRHYRNTDHNFVDENDVTGITHAFVNARAKFRNEFDVAAVVGSRERRQIQGEIELSPLDFLAGRTFPDTVVTAESNFDSHGFTIHPVFMVVAPDEEALRAHVPFRCMLPQQVEGLLVTGLGMSAHRDALPVIRMQPDVQNQGYGAGLAAAMAVAGNSKLRDINMRQLQQKLVDKGVLDSAVLTHEDSFPLDEQTIRATVKQDPLDLFSVAVIFAHTDISVPLLLQELRTAKGQRKEDIALILGLCGNMDVAPDLVSLVADKSWDDGWNYRGMGQFGLSLSRVDTLVVALGKTQSPAAVAPILEKIQALDETSAFSHCRAVSVAASALPDADLSEALYHLLQRPGMQGHAHLNSAQVVAHANSEPNENAARNDSLKELILGRGLYLCGDYNGLGKGILETYTNDLRGHYARHAQAVLQYPDIDTLRVSVL